MTLNEAQANAGTSVSRRNRLGSIVIVNPGHPLRGQSFRVVRRYRERGEQLWVIELPDGSRQYVPASWATPLALTSEEQPMAGDSYAGGQVPDGVPLLSLAGLRDLAALVRRLQARGTMCQEAHDDEGGGNEQRTATAASRQPLATGVGELPSRQSPAGDPGNRADGTTAAARRRSECAAGGPEVTA
jgi:hypothetical protein